MTELKTSGGYFTFLDQLVKLQDQYEWAEFIANNGLDQLEMVADIVCLGTLWHTPKLWGNDKYNTLRLEYRGRANNHKDAFADLDKIMTALNIQELKLDVIGGGDVRPHGVYKGYGKLGVLPVMVELDVQWIPDTCQVEMTQRRPHCTVRIVSYHVICRR